MISSFTVMTPILENVFLTVLSVSSKAAMMAVIIGLLCRCLRRWIPAGWRHGLWLLVFLRLMWPGSLGEFPWALPSWPELPPTVGLQSFSPSEARTQAPPRVHAASPSVAIPSHEVMLPTPPEVLTLQPSPEPLPARTENPVLSARTTESPASQTTVPWMLIAAGLWLTGAIAWWACLVVGWLRFRYRVLKSSTPASEGLTRMLAEVQAQAGTKSRATLRVTEKLHTPAICGLWRPVILLPAEAIEVLPEEKVRLLLLHELGHIQRMDVMVQVLSSVFLGLHWFNPLLWYAHRQLRDEAETATDGWVLEHSGSNEMRRYGEVLIDLAARCSWMGWLFFLAPSVIGAAGSGSTLRMRIRAITTYRRASRWSVLAGIGCVAAMIATGMTQAPQVENTSAADRRGTSTWTSTPPRDVAASVSHESSQDQKVPVKEDETEVTVTPQPRRQITIKLRIVDATTGKLVPNCTVERGQAFPRTRDDEEMRTAWPPNPSLKADAHGMLEDTLNEENELVVYRITAEGYTPFITRVLDSKNGKAIEEMKLRPVKSLAVQIMQPDGRPAAGAFVYALLRAKGFSIEDLSTRVTINNVSSTDPLEASVEADEHGVCALPPSSDDTMLLVVHESGFATALWSDMPRGTPWKLGPWARAEATVQEDGKPVAGVEYEYQGSMALPGQHYVNVRFTGTSDAQGKIVMPRVFPAMQAHFAELIPASNSRSSYSPFMGEYEFKVTRAGETTHFDLTPLVAKSWTVTGRFVTESGPFINRRLPNSFALIKERTTTSGSHSSFNTANVRSDGTFEAGPLAPGEYRILLWDKDEVHFTVKSPLLTLPEVPRGATLQERRRDIGDVVLMDHASADTKLQTPEGRTRFRITVTDTEGKPLQGVSIKPVAFRVKEDTGTSLNLKQAVPDLSREPVLTDARGIAGMECAAKTTDGATLTALQLAVLRDGYLGSYALFARANVNTSLPLLKAGTVMAKVMWKGKPVDSDRMCITSSKEIADADNGFIREADRTYVNRSLREGPLLVQAMWKSDEGSLLFSKPVEVMVANGKPVDCTLDLEPGLRLKGRLDSQVPRPVKNARIGVCAMNHVKKNENALISIGDWQEVREDGTFEFASLPPGQLRVVVLAEGWMHTYEPDSWNIVRPLNLIMPVPDEVIIPMTRTATCEVLVLGRDGQPLPGVMVTAWPNLNWDGKSNGLLSIDGPRLGERLSAPLKPRADWEPFKDMWRFYGVTTNSEGRALLANLPAGSQRLQVFSKAFKFGEDVNTLVEGRSDELTPGTTGKVVLRVQK